MQGPATHPSAGGVPRPSLAQRAFPRRVRALLEGILDYVADELDRGLVTALNELEQQLFKLAEQAKSNELQANCFAALREVKRGRADMIPRFLLGLEAELAAIKDPPRKPDAVLVRHELSLVADVVMDEAIVVNEIAGRAEIRNSLPLFLLGQRFGVIAGRPAFDAESLPVGPHALCRVLRDAVGTFDLSTEHKTQIYRQFDRNVMQFIGPLYEALNTYLIRQRVLPYLTYVPVRAKRIDAQIAERAAKGFEERTGRDTTLAGATPHAPRGGVEPAAAQPAPAARDAVPRSRTGAAPGGARPFTAWPGTGEAPSPQTQADSEMFDVLRQLLAGRRTLLGKLGNDKKGAPQAAATHPVSPQQVQQVLGALQSKPALPVMVDGQAQPRSVTHLKQDMLAQLRRITPEGLAPTLPEEQGDTIELVGMLFDHIMKDVRPHSPAAALLTKLQVPLLRVALDDKGFFTRKQHPARQMLNTIAESGQYWTSDDEADRALVDKMHMLVDRVTREFDGDLSLFDALLGDLSSHMQTQARKAEVAERRHVEAARGKEKLELARLRAAEAIDVLLAGKHVPKFLHTLLAQAWADVLALSLLRGGDESPVFRHQLRLAERLIEAGAARHDGRASPIPQTEVPALKIEIEEALAQVGYHANDAQAISHRLLSAAHEEEEDDPASRTELAMRLKSRARLGQNVDTAASGERTAPLDAAEKACYEQIRHLPFGTWFEFVVNQQGDVARRRLSWYSTLTGHCLFVNHRGQRLGEYSLNWLAREMKRGNLRVVQAESESMIDRAWGAIVNALKSFAGRGNAPAQG
jgi:hypothetical protein